MAHDVLHAACKKSSRIRAIIFLVYQDAGCISGCRLQLIYIYVCDMQAAAATAPHLTTVTTRVRRERSVWNMAARWLQGRKKNGVGLEARFVFGAEKRALSGWETEHVGAWNGHLKLLDFDKKLGAAGRR